jgi:hypothetical protein
MEFEDVMKVVIERYGSAVEIIHAHSCEVDPTRKSLLEIAGLYCSYLQLKGKVPNEDCAGAACCHRL